MRLAYRSTSVIAGQVTVGTTAVQLPAAVARFFLLRVAPGDAPNFDVRVALGPSTVTLATGFPLAATDMLPVTLEVMNLNHLWAIANVADATLAYFGEV